MLHCNRPAGTGDPQRLLVFIFVVVVAIIVVIIGIADRPIVVIVIVARPAGRDLEPCGTGIGLAQHFYGGGIRST